MNYIDDFPIDAPRGWVCPKCGRVYSPTMPFCLSCGNGTTTATTNVTATTNTNFWDEISRIIRKTDDSNIFRVHYEDEPKF